MSHSLSRCFRASLLALCTFGLALAQEETGTLTGVVIDGATGKPLAGAVVVATSPALQGARTEVSDHEGRFQFQALPPGSYRLEARAHGFLPEVRAELALGASTTLRASLAVTPEVVELEEVVITGSRIRRKDLTTPAPVTVIGRDEIAQSGRTTIGEFLQVLPEQSNGLNRQFNNGGDGSARISLRGLGDHRTLVLVNGRRFVAGGTGADRAVDLNAIPAAAVERIEVLKDGASPIYGSDAMGGVVNIITRRRWTGLEVGASGGATARGDAVSSGLDLALGKFGDEAGFLLSGSLVHLGSAMAGDRSWSSKPYGWDFATGTKTTIGSGAIPAGLIVIQPGERGVQNGNQLWNDLVAAYPTTRKFVRDPAAPLGWRPYLGAALPQDGGDGYNYQPENYLITPLRLMSVLASGEMAISSSARFSFEASYVNRRSEQLLAPLPLDTSTDAGTVSAANIYNPFGRDFDVVRRRLVEVERRRFSQDVDIFRVVGSLDGTLPEGWGPLAGLGWEVSANFGRTQATQILKGYLSGRMMEASLGPSFVDSGPDGVLQTGPGQAPRGDDVARCGTPASPIAGCVPLNLFGGPGSITPDMLNQLTYTGMTRGTNELVSLQANASGDLFRLAAERLVGLAAGYEYRSVFGEFIPDTLSMTGDRLDVRAQPTRGRADVHELYAELSAPVVEGRPMADLVEAMVAARAFAHQGFAPDWTWKAGARWRPIRDLTLRGTASTAYRVPAVQELYLGQTLGDFNFAQDPCADLDPASNPAATPTRIARCLAAGAPAGGTQRFGLVPAPVVGNAALRPELARVFTAGVVIEPRITPGLSATVDYWTASVTRTIGEPGGSMILESCYPRVDGATPSLCHLVDRDPATGILRGVTDQFQNAGYERAAGIDFAVRYSLPTAAGRVGASLDATWLARHDLQLADGTVIKTKGNYDAFFASLTAYSGLNPEWKANAGLTWAMGGLRAGATVHFVSAFKECGNTDPDTGQTVTDVCSLGAPLSRRVSPWFGFDAMAEYEVRARAGRTKVSVGVQNVLDRAPPFVASNGVYMSDPSLYDVLGRSFQARLSHAF